MGSLQLSGNVQDMNSDMQSEKGVRDDILSELISAIGLQRFRFIDRQSSGMYIFPSTLLCFNVLICSFDRRYRSLQMSYPHCSNYRVCRPIPN